MFKRNKRDKHAVYLIQYRDVDGTRKTVKGFTDKGLTEELAAKLEGEARLHLRGMIDSEQSRYTEQKLAPIIGHVEAYQLSLADNVPRYIKDTMTRVRNIIAGCGFVRLSDIEPESVQQYLRSLRAAKTIGHRTYNHYLQAIEAFLNWCVKTRRLLANPLRGMDRLNTEVDIRRKRRALTVDEVAKLVAAARNSSIRIQTFSGEQRARIYLLAFLTGLRRNEIGSLTARSFDLNAEPPTITVEAAFSKHRRKDVLPLHPELAVAVKTWLAEVDKDTQLFPRLGSRKTWTMVRKDLESAGIPFETAEGVADFHAAGRHSHITELLRNGVSLPEAKQLARHSHVKTTMRYTHIGIGDQARAVSRLPVPKTTSHNDTEAALHGRCNPSVPARPLVSQPDATTTKENQQNPRESRGNVANCHPMSPDDKVGVIRVLHNRRSHLPRRILRRHRLKFNRTARVAPESRTTLDRLPCGFYSKGFAKPRGET